MSIRNVRVSEIVVDAGTQVRAAINESAVSEYAEAMRSGAEFPPIIVFHDGNRYLCADGFHRTLAAARIERDTIKADVRQGAKQDALKFALSANVAHGLRRTNADKRQSVGLALTEWPTRSDRWIADVCGVSDRFVNEVRASLSTANSSQLTRTGSDGRTRRLPQRAADSSAVSPAPERAQANEDQPRVVTATQRQAEASELSAFLETLGDVVTRAGATLTQRDRWKFADELEASAIDLRNQ